MEEFFHNLFNGPVGYITVGIIIILFLMSFSFRSRREVEREVNPDAELGRVVRKLFKLLGGD